MTTDPREKLALSNDTGTKIFEHLRDRIFISDQLVAVQIKKRHQRQLARPFVAIKKWLVLGYEESVRGGFLWYGWIRVFTERALLRLEDSGRKELLRPHAVDTPEYQRVRVEFFHLIDGQVDDSHGHSLGQPLQ